MVLFCGEYHWASGGRNEVRGIGECEVGKLVKRVGKAWVGSWGSEGMC